MPQLSSERPGPAKTTIPGEIEGAEAALTIERLKRRHPIWEEGFPKWQTTYDVIYDRVMDKIEEYLPKGKDEDLGDYSERQKFARFKSECPTVLQRIVGAAMATSPKRPEEIVSKFTEFMENADNCGTTFECWVEEALYDALAFGADFTILDMPTVDSKTNTVSAVTSKQFEPALTVRPNVDISPRCVKYRRHQLVDWDHDSCGEFHWVRLHEVVRIAPTPDFSPMKADRYTEWDRMSWRKFDIIKDDKGDDRVLFRGQGDHNLGIVPIAILWIVRSMQMRFEPFLKGAVHHDIEQFQSDADLRYNMWNHGHLGILDGRDSNQMGRVATGPNSVNKCNFADGEDIRYTKPPMEAMEIHRRNKEDSRAGVRRNTGIDPLGGSDEKLSMVSSGKARNVSFAVSEERFLRKDAKALERFEKRIFEILERWDSGREDVPPEERLNTAVTTYPQKFNLDAAETQIKNWIEARTQINSDTLDRELQKQVAQTLLGTVTAETMAEILEQIQANGIINKVAAPKTTEAIMPMGGGITDDDEPQSDIDDEGDDE